MLILTYLTYLFEVIRLLMVVEREGVYSGGSHWKEISAKGCFLQG